MEIQCPRKLRVKGYKRIQAQSSLSLIALSTTTATKMSLDNNGQYLLEPYKGPDDVLSILRHWLADRIYPSSILQ